MEHEGPGKLFASFERSNLVSPSRQTRMNARLTLRSPLSPHACAVGLVLTLTLFASVLSWIDPVVLTSTTEPEVSVAPRAERVHFVPASVPTLPDVPAATIFQRTARPATTDSSSRPARSEEIAPSAASASHPVEETNTLTPQASRLSLPSSTWHNRDPSLPYIREAAERRAPLTAAERDSANRAFAREAATRVPSAEERDSAQRAKSAPGTIPGRRAGEQGVGVGGSIPIPLPCFCSAPSAAERKRDSVALAENLERLARLRARAQARRDSNP